MSVLRAAFLIPVIALLAPAGSDTGLARGDLAGGDFLSSVREGTLEALTRVKADIAAQRRGEGPFEVTTVTAHAEPALRSDLARESWGRLYSPP